ncbi:MAG: PilZ domain-containing protein [Nitrospinota bacterium]|nr:PilZ domain-containing protein [Nitrospinota bacterium]MDH5678171.1 PilZ domain-containing protein [Nitrospinota bacterium]MDH5755844.1 PilZ domain-containing protein [Nitrospinota bacterium]
MSREDVCPCCKRPFTQAADFSGDLDDTKDFIQAARTTSAAYDPRRSHPREKKIISLKINVNGITMEAVTMDLSASGARIFYLSDYIPVNAQVIIESDEKSLGSGRGVAVWSKQQEKTYSVSGIKFV